MHPGMMGSGHAHACGCQSSHCGCVPRHFGRWERHFYSDPAQEALPSGTFGVRRPLRFLAYKLQLDPRQVGELAAILNELKTERVQAGRAAPPRRARRSKAPRGPPPHAPSLQWRGSSLRSILRPAHENALPTPERRPERSAPIQDSPRCPRPPVAALRGKAGRVLCRSRLRSRS